MQVAAAAATYTLKPQQQHKLQQQDMLLGLPEYQETPAVMRLKGMTEDNSLSRFFFFGCAKEMNKEKVGGCSAKFGTFFPGFLARHRQFVWP